ncbi:hypothetical protein LXL04_008963 [Taraxacum kok-saghyz]
MSFEIGESVEVIDNEYGMEGSYFKGKVIDCSPGRRTIRYDTLIVDDGSPLEEAISVRDFDPLLPLSWHDIILETWHLQINMFPIQKHTFVFIKSGRNWRKDESGSMSIDRVEGIKHNEGWWVGRYGPGLFAALMLSILGKKGGIVEWGRKLGRKQVWKRDGRKQGNKTG